MRDQARSGAIRRDQMRGFNFWRSRIDRALIAHFDRACAINARSGAIRRDQAQSGAIRRDQCAINARSMRDRYFSKWISTWWKRVNVYFLFSFLVWYFTDQLSHIHIFKFTLANLVFELKPVLEVYYLLYNSMKIPQNARGEKKIFWNIKNTP